MWGRTMSLGSSPQRFPLNTQCLEVGSAGQGYCLHFSEEDLGSQVEVVEEGPGRASSGPCTRCCAQFLPPPLTLVLCHLLRTSSSWPLALLQVQP